jgi:hypothetical protein
MSVSSGVTDTEFVLSRKVARLIKLEARHILLLSESARDGAASNDGE